MARGLLLLLLASGLMAATPPAGTVTAGRSVSVDGVDISTQGVPTWPLAPGDEVATGNEPAIVTLNDGSRFLLDRNSRVRVARCSSTVLEVLQGSVTYRFAAASTAQLCVLGRPVKAATMVQGTVTIENPDQAVVRTPNQQAVSLPAGACLCSTSSRRKTTILILAAAGAAGLAAGLGLTLPSSVSASTPQ